MGRIYLKKLMIFCFLNLVVTGTFSLYAHADDPDLVPGATGPAELSGCAADTWTAMVNQAVMETRRQDILNKRFVVKADSVLQYSCFADSLWAAGAGLPPIFSGGETWASRRVDLIGKEVTIRIYEKDQEVEEPYFVDYLQPRRPAENKPSTLEENLFFVVDEAYRQYIDGQFDHKVLSGTTGLSDKKELCYNMSQVWKAARCKHFDSAQVFYTFDDLTSTEPREFPEEMNCNN